MLTPELKHKTESNTSHLFYNAITSINKVLDALFSVTHERLFPNPTIEVETELFFYNAVSNLDHQSFDALFSVKQEKLDSDRG